MIIVHMLTRLLRAGSEENTIATCRAQLADGHTVYLVHGQEADPVYAGDWAGDLRVVRVASMVHPLHPVQDVRAIRDLWRLLRVVRPDVVHTHQSKAGILGRVAAWLARVPVIIHGVHIVPFAGVGRVQQAVYIAAERMTALFTDAFISVSRGVRDAYLAERIGAPARHHVVHSGFAIDRFRQPPLPDDWRALVGCPKGAARPPVLVMLAALEERKRHCEFLEAFPAVLALHPGTILLLAGEGPHRAAVEATISRLGLSANVRLLGHRPDPERLIALADIGLLASTKEGLPRVVMQFLVAGTPCVVCDLPGLDEVLHDGENGLVADPHDLADMVARIGALLDDPARLEALRQGAERSDLASWDVAAMCRGMADVYRQAGCQ